MDYAIRPFEEKDFEEIYEIRSFESTMVTLGAMPTQSFDELKEHLSAGGIGRLKHILVAETELPGGETKVIGLVVLSLRDNPRFSHCGTISGVSVHEDFRGQGVGATLVKAMLAFSDKWLMLHRIDLYVRENNDHAITMYEKLGFEKEGLSRDVVIARGRYESAWCMARLKSFGGEGRA